MDEERTPPFTSRIIRDGEWFVASSPEFPEGNGQGHTEAEALESLRESIALLINDAIPRQHGHSSFEKPVLSLPDGSSYTPSDVEWLEHLARRIFEVEADSQTLFGADPDEAPFEDFARFLFHLYNKRDPDNQTALEKVGAFGKAVAKFIAAEHRSFALDQVAMELESEETTGLSKEQRASRSKTLRFRPKIELHRAASNAYPFLFQGGYSPDSPNESMVSKMWARAGQSFRKSKPWGNNG